MEGLLWRRINIGPVLDIVNRNLGELEETDMREKFDSQRVSGKESGEEQQLTEDPSGAQYIELIKPYYVYALADPFLDNEIFYVGKGKAQRGYDHLKDALKQDTPDSKKISRIRLIRDQGSEPLVRVIARFDTEDAAFAVESTLIHWVYGFGNLTNDQPGHGSRQVRSRDEGLIPELPGIDIAKRIKVAGKRTGYLDDIISNHQRLGHLEMMQDLCDFLKGRGIPLEDDEVIGLEGGRYLGLRIPLNSCVRLVLHITDSDRHSIILNLRSNSEKADDRRNFSEFVSKEFQIEPKNDGRYAKLESWRNLKLSVEEHSKIHKLVTSVFQLMR